MQEAEAKLTLSYCRLIPKYLHHGIDDIEKSDKYIWIVSVFFFVMLEELKRERMVDTMTRITQYPI